MKPPHTLVRILAIPALIAALSGNALTAGKAQKGDLAPDFSASSLDGRKVALSGHRGKSPVLLFFFAEFASGSRKDFARLKDLDDQYADKGLRVIALAQDEEKDGPVRLASSVRARFPLVLDRDAAIAGKYGVQALPHAVVIDRSGRIAAVVVGSDADPLDKAVAQVLK